MGSAKRTEGKDQHGQQAVKRADRQFAWIDGSLEREGNPVLEGRGDGEGQCGAEPEPGANADHRYERHFGEAGEKHIAAGGAQRFQGCQVIALALDEGAHRVGDADAPHDQRREADEGEELGEAVQIFLELWRDIGPAADFPAGLGKCGAGLGDGRSDGRVAGRAPGGVARQGQAVEPAHQRARLHEAGRAEGIDGHQHARAEADAAGELVGFGDQLATIFEGSVADKDAIADLQVEASSQGCLGDETGRARVGGERLLHGRGG